MKANIGRVPYLVGKGMPQGYQTITVRELRQRKIHALEKRLTDAIAQADMERIVYLNDRINELKSGKA